MNRLDQKTSELVFECFRASIGIRATARKLGIARGTATKYLRLFEAGEQTAVLCACGKPRHTGWCKAQENAERVEALCGCGQPIRHRGWCRVRLARSPERQAFLRSRWGKLVNKTVSPPPPLPVPQIVPRTVPPAPPIVIAPPPDPRIVQTAVPTFTEAEKKSLAKRRYFIQRRARSSKSSIEDLRAIVAASDAPIQKLPVGAHTGWRPSWLDV
jgi:hypothetical protein